MYIQLVIHNLSFKFCTEISVSHNFMETEAHSLRFGEFKAVGKKKHASLFVHVMMMFFMQHCMETLMLISEQQVKAL